MERIGKTMLWVKADPTFAGLKQVLNEPEARVFIGAAPPNYKPDHKVISRILIPSSNAWFPADFKLELNRDLVTIIGGRGSGKSALAEAIAYGGGSKDNGEDAFLKKAAKHRHTITGTKIKLEWADGTPTEFEVGKLGDDCGLVQYLPQGAVEDLCSHKNSEKLQKQIENVIFQSLDETEKMGASDFEELRSKILSGFQYETDQIVERIRDINRRISNLVGVLKSLPEKERILNEKKQEHGHLTQSLPELPPEDKKGQEELAGLSELKKKFEMKIILLQNRLTKTTEIETKVKVFKTKIQEFSAEISALLDSIGVSNKDSFAVSLDEDGIKTLIENEKKEIAAQLKTLKEGAKDNVAELLSISTSALPFDNLQSLNKGIEDKQKETRAFETIKLKYQQQKKTALDLGGSMAALENEIAKIKTESKPEKERLETDRLQMFCYYFDVLKNEKAQIEELYKPLQETLLAGTATDTKLVFEAQINYRLEPHCKNGLDIIDRTRRGNFREANSLRKALSNLWDDCARNDFKYSVIEANFKKILNDFALFEGTQLEIEDQLREDYSIEHFYNWLFDPTHFEIISSLKFDDSVLLPAFTGQKRNHTPDVVS